MDAKSSPPIRAIIAPVTPLQQNCTIVWCTKTMKAAIIDPGGEVDRLQAILEKQGLTLEKIWITHGHLDHAGGTAELKARTGVPIEGPHPDDQFWIDDRRLCDRLLLDRAQRRDAVIEPLHEYAAVGAFHRGEQLHEQHRGLGRPAAVVPAVKLDARSVHRDV